MTAVSIKNKQNSKIEGIKDQELKRQLNLHQESKTQLKNDFLL
jgi:hypothetical protein